MHLVGIVEGLASILGEDEPRKDAGMAHRRGPDGDTDPEMPLHPPLLGRPLDLTQPRDVPPTERDLASGSHVDWGPPGGLAAGHGVALEPPAPEQLLAALPREVTEASACIVAV